MKNRVLLGTFALLAMLSMSGCGGGNDDVNNEANNNGSSVSTGTAFYIDAAVGGVNYKCGSQEGITGVDGAFTFEVGGSCTFYLGDMKLRDVDAGLLVDGKNVYETDVKIGRILQSLDLDGNLDNGITIAANTVQALANAGITSLPTSEVEMNEILAVIVANGGTEVSEEDAAKHMLISVLGGKTFYAVGKSQNDVWQGKAIFNATLTEMIFSSGTEVARTIALSIVGNRLMMGTDGSYSIMGENKVDYIKFTDYSANGTIERHVRLFFDKIKADAYFLTLSGGDVTPGSEIEITEAMLSTKTFYDKCDNNEGCHAKMTFNVDGTGTRREIYIDNEVRKDESFTLPYALIDGKMEISGSNGDGSSFYMLFTLRNITDNTWVLNRQDGKTNPTFTTDIWFMTKPSGFPAEL